MMQKCKVSQIFGHGAKQPLFASKNTDQLKWSVYQPMVGIPTPVAALGAGAGAGTGAGSWAGANAGAGAGAGAGAAPRPCT